MCLRAPLASPGDAVGHGCGEPDGAAGPTPKEDQPVNDQAKCDSGNTTGVHHVTFLTEDMDRLLAFYVCVFDAEVTLDVTEEDLRHAFLRVGPKTVLHPFQMLDGPDPPPPSPMFTAAGMDHLRCWLPMRQRSGSWVSGSWRRARSTAASGT